jgi:hypothetical protein
MTQVGIHKIGEVSTVIRTGGLLAFLVKPLMVLGAFARFWVRISLWLNDFGSQNSVEKTFRKSVVRIKHGGQNVRVRVKSARSR